MNEHDTTTTLNASHSHPQDAVAVADFWFDPVCPWAWISSRWAGEVTQVRDVEFRWHIFSLGALNENKDVEPEYRELLKKAWGPARVVAAARNAHGDSVIKPLYDELGNRIHLGKQKDYDIAIAEALQAVGLPQELALAAHREDLDDDLRAGNAEALSLVGDDVGVPIISVEGAAFFGPVLTPIPRGEQAGKLWDGVLLVATTPGFYELKRSRTVGPSFD